MTQTWLENRSPFSTRPHFIHARVGWGPVWDHDDNNIMRSNTGADPGFWSGGQWSFDQKGGLSPKFAQNRAFPLKLPKNCMILKKSWGQGGLGPPWIRHCNNLRILPLPCFFSECSRFCLSVSKSRKWHKIRLHKVHHSCFVFSVVLWLAFNKNSLFTGLSIVAYNIAGHWISWRNHKNSPKGVAQKASVYLSSRKKAGVKALATSFASQIQTLQWKVNFSRDFTAGIKISSLIRVRKPD